MEILTAPTHAEVSRAAAAFIVKVIREKPDATILVATGNTPMDAYALLPGMVDASQVIAFQLDEYVGVPEDDERSLYGWMERSFVTPLGIPSANVRKLDGCAADLGAVCRAYDELIRAAGGFDLCILGLGPNGHLGFNEPPSEPDAPTRAVDLTPESLASNAVYWKNAVPTRAMTVGMAPILAAKQTLLMSTGARKHAILTQAMNGPISPEVPASQLRLAKGRVIVAADRAALEGE